MIYFLTGILLVIFVALFLYHKNDILEPSIIFTFSFLILSIMALLNSKRFHLGLHFNTFCVILGGVLLFDIISIVIKEIYKKMSNKKELIEEPSIIKPNKYMQIAFLVFVFVFCFAYIYFIMKAVGVKFTGIRSIATAISKYDSSIKFNSRLLKVKIPFIITNLRVCLIGVGYWLLYVIIYNYVYFKKISILEIINLIPCFILSFLEGSRTPGFFMMVSSIIMFMIFMGRKNGLGKVLSKKLIIGVLIVGLIFVVTFKPAAKLLGRNINFDFNSYISIYCGAQLKNLDIFLNTKHKNNNIVPGAQTFLSLINSYGSRIGFKGYKNYQLDLPFQKVGNVDLGNVYTTFYPYIYDFGYVGLIILVIIMAAISQLFYEIIKKSSFDKFPKKAILLYGLIGTCLLLSFFSNKFYEHIFNLELLKYLVAWFLCDLFFIKKFNMKRKIANEKE